MSTEKILQLLPSNYYWLERVAPIAGPIGPLGIFFFPHCSPQSSYLTSFIVISCLFKACDCSFSINKTVELNKC